MDDYAGMSDETAATDDRLRPRPHRHWYRLALVFTIVLVVAVVATLPLAIRSMQEVLGRAPEPLFDLLTGEVVSAEAAAAAEQEATYVNLGMVDLDDSTGLLTLAVSGNRLCGDACPALDITFFALDDDADQRRGLPPSATLSLGPDDLIFSQTVQLPLRGQPSLYPFDTYEVWLGVGGVGTLPDGTTLELRPETLGGRAEVTLQNRIPDMIMDAPTPIDPAVAGAAADPFAFLAVQDIVFERPAYLKVLAVVLVLLIAVSAAMALLTREVNDLALGIGGLILGVWGIRSILMPQGVSTVTAIDLALSWLILLLLLGLALRVALHFHRHSDLPLPKPRSRRPR
jgi:hypothetical protein